ncbi:MAG: hypothetical protein NUV77_13705 [Thermoguttaceae bacterium]|nr:hypothetical protein [Thermoguttaceae bacterium]
MSIYKPCDIRGDATTELSPDLYRVWGLALGRRIAPGEKFVIGGDVRASTPEFLAALAEGLCRAGVDVVDVGILPTPMIYYAKRRLRAPACAIVTASHNPAHVNGLKWMVGELPPTRADVRALQHATQPGACRARRKRTVPRRLDVTFDYVAWLQEVWAETPPVPHPIVLDPMHGCWACRSRRYLQAVFPHSVFAPIHDSPDAAFAGRIPDCSRHELLDELAQAVEHQGAYMGIAFDGDGDRVAFVDDEGNALTAEEATWILLQSFADQWPGERFVYDLKFSDRIAESARQLGAEPIVERSGHAFLRTRMLKTRALFGAEVSGHYFFRELDGGDDGLYAACRMIAFLAHSGVRLSDLRRRCPRVFSTPDLRVALPAARQRRILDLVRRAWPDRPRSELDGVRVEFPEGWALVRGSVTESALTFRFEATDWLALNDLIWRFAQALPEIGDEVWLRYQASQGISTEP